MEILNIGPLELVLIVLVALIVLGPNESINVMRKLGRWIYKIAKSPYWATIMNTSKEIRDLPNMIVREAGLEESIKELKNTSASLSKDMRDLDQAISKEEIISREDIPTIHVKADLTASKTGQSDKTEAIVDEQAVEPDVVSTSDVNLMVEQKDTTTPKLMDNTDIIVDNQAVEPEVDSISKVDPPADVKDITTP